MMFYGYDDSNCVPEKKSSSSTSSVVFFASSLIKFCREANIIMIIGGCNSSCVKSSIVQTGRKSTRQCLYNFFSHFSMKSPCTFL